MKNLILICLLATLCQGCIVCSADRVFPKVTFRWTHDGKREIESRQEAAAFAKEYKDPTK
jgi:hypothetical protein